jgi:lipopolysaccharide/colanic/teichoic acid biosynthesis glycosyltransferase
MPVYIFLTRFVPQTWYFRHNSAFKIGMNPRAVRHLVFGFDLLWIVVCAIAAYMLRTSSPWNTDHLRIAVHESSFLMAAAGAAWPLVFYRLKLDGFYGGYETAATLSQLFTGAVALALLVASASFLFHEDGSRLLLAGFAGLFFVTAFAGRMAARNLARRFAASGTRRRALIVGRDKVAQELAERIRKHPEMRWEVIGFLFPSADDVVAPILSSGTSQQLNSLGIESLLKQQAVDELVLAAPVPDQGEMLNLVADCRNRGVRVSVVPNLYQLYVNRPTLVDLDGLPLLHFAEGRPAPMQAAVKRVFDVALSCALLLAGFPLLVVVGLLVWLRHHKVLVSERRCGRNGRAFRMYRFYTRGNAGNASGLERLLRVLSITELPQLINVLKGEMSLVGPRPETEERVKRYSEWQRQRLICKPGMTGLAQVHGLREENSSEDKAYYDLRYLQDASLLTDVALIVQTMWTLLRRLFTPKTCAVLPLEEGAPAGSSNEFGELAHADRS